MTGGTYTWRRAFDRRRRDQGSGLFRTGLRRRGNHRCGGLVTISYKFVQQLFVYDIIVGISGFGRSPTRLGLGCRPRLATCYNRDYDPCPAFGRGQEGYPV
jgi:hypothetical protein